MHLDPYRIRAEWTHAQLWMAMRTMQDLGEFEASLTTQQSAAPKPKATADWFDRAFGVDNDTRFLSERQLLMHPELLQG